MKEISDAIRINMFYSQVKEEILNLKEKTDLIKSNRFGVHHSCTSKEKEVSK